MPGIRNLTIPDFTDDSNAVIPAQAGIYLLMDSCFRPTDGEAGRNDISL